MAGIGTISVSIVTDITNFQAGVLKAIDALTGLVAKSTEVVAQTTRTSERLGTTAENLMTLDTVARRTGGSVDVLESGLSRMVRNLGAAGESAGKLNRTREALNMLHLSLRDLQKMDKVEAVEKIAEAMNKVTNSTQRAFIETAIFAGHGGIAGQQMDLVLKQLANGTLEDLKKKFEQTGEVLSNLNTEKIRLMSDDFKRLESQLTGVGNILASAIAPYVTYVIDLFLDWANSGGGVAAKINAALKFVGDGIGWVVNGLDLMIAGWYLFQSVVNSVIDFVIIGPIRALAIAVDTIVVSFQNAMNSIINTINTIMDEIHALKNETEYLMTGKIAAQGDSFHIKPFSVNDTGFSNTMDKAHNELKKNAEEGAKGFTDHITKWLRGDAHDEFMKAFNKIGDDFEKKAKLMIPKIDDSQLASDGLKEGKFQQINPSLINAAGLHGANKVHLSADKVTHEHLATHTKLLTDIAQHKHGGSGRARTTQ